MTKAKWTCQTRLTKTTDYQQLILALVVLDEATSPNDLSHFRTRCLVHYLKGLLASLKNRLGSTLSLGSAF